MVYRHLSRFSLLLILYWVTHLLFKDWFHELDSFKLHVVIYIRIYGSLLFCFFRVILVVLCSSVLQISLISRNILLLLIRFFFLFTIQCYLVSIKLFFRFYTKTVLLIPYSNNLPICCSIALRFSWWLQLDILPKELMEMILMQSLVSYVRLPWKAFVPPVGFQAFMLMASVCQEWRKLLTSRTWFSSFMKTYLKSMTSLVWNSSSLWASASSFSQLHHFSLAFLVFIFLNCH